MHLPTIQLTSQVSMLLSKGALRLQPGQWVAGEKGIGRYLRTDHRTGTTYVSWVRPGDDWTTQSQRFHRAHEGVCRQVCLALRGAEAGAPAATGAMSLLPRLFPDGRGQRVIRPRPCNAPVRADDAQGHADFFVGHGLGV